MDTNELDFPAIIRGEGPLDAYVRSSKANIDAALDEAGAVLFRGFNVDDPLAFDSVVEAYGEAGFTYEESLSNAVRVNVTPRVFTANEAPPEAAIYLHHEMAQTPIYPSKLFFYCETAPSSGGATPVCRSDWLVEKLIEQVPYFVDRLSELGVRYRHTMPGDDDAASGQGRSWKSTLSVRNRETAEAKLSELGYEFEWQSDGSLLVTTPILPAIRDVGSGRRSFFNQLIAAYRGWAADPEESARTIMYGDKSSITRSDMEKAVELAEQITHDLAWQAGDVALLDNHLVMHGRRPFAGKRRVLASLVR